MIKRMTKNKSSDFFLMIDGEEKSNDEKMGKIVKKSWQHHEIDFYIAEHVFSAITKNGNLYDTMVYRIWYIVPREV